MAKRNDLLAGVASAALIVAVTISTPAFAADPVNMAPVAEFAPALPEWAGFYLGGHVGGGEATFRGSVSSGCSSCVDFDVHGFLLGFHAGHNWQMNSLLIGIEGDLSAANWDGGEEEDDSFSGVWGEVQALASLRARLGMTFDRALIYATGGVAFAQNNATAASTTAFGIGNGAGEIDVGVVAGGGVAWKVRQDLSLRGEAMYYWFDEDKSTPGSSDAHNGLQDAWVVRVGASWHLN